MVRSKGSKSNTKRVSEAEIRFKGKTFEGKEMSIKLR